VSIVIPAVAAALGLGGLGYWLRVKYTGRCDQCGRRFVASTAARWCLGGHKVHQTCVAYATNREVCPNCGIYVSEFAGSAIPI